VSIGYLSSHFVVSLKNNRTKLTEWKAYNNFKAEIQVRTVLQHAWAAISHELEYKKSYDIPSILKRKLFRLAGIIELADEEFQEAKEKHKIVELSIKEKKPLNNINVFEEVNLNTIQSYFNNTNNELEVIELNSIKAGFTLDNEDHHLVTNRNRYLSEIIEICELKSIVSMDELNKQVKILSGLSQKNLSNIYGKKDNVWIVSIEFLVLLLFIISLDATQIKQFSGVKWAKSIWNDINLKS
jgi:putative GTP pyrophosphokinase